MEDLNEDYRCGNDRVLDVGSGSGRVAKEVLLSHFTSVDMMDKCPKACEEADELKRSNDKVGNIAMTSM